MQVEMTSFRTLLTVALFGGCIAQVACAPRLETRVSPDCCRGVRAPENALHSLDKLMNAARWGDTIAMKRLAMDQQPIGWLLGRRAATPEFFEQTRTLDHADYADTSRSVIEMSLSVAYRSFVGLCERRDPPDVLLVTVTVAAGVWKIARVQNQVC